MKRHIGAVSAVTLMAMALTGCGSDSTGLGQEADEAASGCELEGERIDLVVPYSPGGNYDQYARLVAPRLGEELGAEVVVLNQPGAGGLLAANTLFSAPPDGRTIAIFNMPGIVGGALGGGGDVNFEPEQFSYIGQVSSEPAIVIVQAAGPHERFEDLLDAAESRPIRFSATGPGSSEYIDPLVLERALGMDVEVVSGFAGNSEAELGLIQGQVDANTGSVGSKLDPVTTGDAEAVVVIGTEQVEELPDVPTVFDFVEGDEQRTLLEFHSRLLLTGRGLAGPPGMTDGCLTELRDAYESAVTDEAFLAEAEKRELPIHFTPGEDVQQEVEELIDAPTAYVDILRAGFSGD